MTRSASLALVAFAAAALAAPAQAAPVLGTETLRGTGTVEALAAKAPSVKTVDGLIGDWTGTGAGYGGVSVRSAGEQIYTDHLFDAWGADDGKDAERLAQMKPVTDALPETYRLEAIMRNDPAGQVGAPSPEQLQYLQNYGDLERDTRADLTELRLSSDGANLLVLARTATMKAADDAALLLLLDTEAGGEDREVPFGAGIRTQKAELAVELSGAGGRIADLRTGEVSELPAGSVATNPDGWTNAIEARLPVTGVEAVAAAARRPGQPLANVAFRHAEPVREWMEKQQALALHAGSIDEFFAAFDGAALAAGATERWRPGTGYHERIFLSTDLISKEEGVDGILQHYGVYLPESLDASKPAPLQLWLHWRGGTAHSAGHTIPGMFRDLGEAHGTIVISPRGRGTSSWYVGRGQVDVEQVWADAHSTYSIDSRRRYVAGHSMGGWGSFLMTILHPDWFAAALPASPPVTQGAWTGLDIGEQCDEFKYDDYSPCYIEANGSDPRAQHTRRLLENVRHVPWAIYHGVEDELVPYSGVARQVERLVELGYRHRFYSFMTQEHFGPPVWDEWKDGGDYMHGFAAPENPARVSYVRDMAFEGATERVNSGGLELDFTFDGAYWLDGLQAVDGTAGRAVFEGRSLAIAEAVTVTAPEAWGPTSVGNTGPFVMTGLQWIKASLAGVPPKSNGFEVTTTGAKAATLDMRRMSIHTTRTVTGTVTADAPLRLSLKGFTNEPRVTVGGVPVTILRDGPVITVDLPAGKSTVVVAPQG
jgi:hypothetical protein